VLLAVTRVVSGALLVVLVAIAAALVLTSIIGVCPMYMPFRMSTRRK